MPPFAIDQFFSVFEQYNEAMWPIHIVAYIFGSAEEFLVLAHTLRGVAFTPK
jgi:hypothetical protein